MCILSHRFSLCDQLGARTWDIEPLCQVIGVWSGSAVIPDGCHGASIHWSDILRIDCFQHQILKKMSAEIVLRSRLVWFLVGVSLIGVASSSKMKTGGAFILLIGLLLTFSSPWTITRLYGGKSGRNIPAHQIRGHHANSRDRASRLRQRLRQTHLRSIKLNVATQRHCWTHRMWSRVNRGPISIYSVGHHK